MSDTAESRATRLEVPRDAGLLADVPSLVRHHGHGLVTVGGVLPETSDGSRVHPGRVGEDVTLADGYAAARFAGLRVLGLLRAATGSLDHIAGFVRTLTFVAVGSGFTDINKVTNGAADLWVEVFGDPGGRATSAGIGVVSLPRGNVFQITATVQVRDQSEQQGGSAMTAPFPMTVPSPMTAPSRREGEER